MGPYRPPPAHACDVLETPIAIDAHNAFFYRTHMYKGRVVDYSIEQHARDSADEPWQTVYRADTSKGTLHEHIFRRGEGQTRRITNQVIPPEEWTGWDVVHQSWLECLDQALEHWEERRRRWDQ